MRKFGRTGIKTSQKKPDLTITGSTYYNGDYVPAPVKLSKLKKCFAILVLTSYGVLMISSVFLHPSLLSDIVVILHGFISGAAVPWFIYGVLFER